MSKRYKEGQVVAIYPNAGYGLFVKYATYDNVVVSCYDHDRGDYFSLVINVYGIRRLNLKEMGLAKRNT